jgi:hypothetical protein
VVRIAMIPETPAGAATTLRWQRQVGTGNYCGYCN